MQIRFFFGFIFFLSGLVLQAQVKRALTPMDVASLKAVAAAAWSADGSGIAYAVRVQSDPTVENKPARAELHLYNVAAGTSTPFVTRGNVRMIAYRPGHQVITFLNRLDNDKVTGLYQIGLTG